MINWIIGGILLIAALLAVRYVWRQHKQGKCAGGCAGCSGCCHGGMNGDEPAGSGPEDLT